MLNILHFKYGSASLFLAECQICLLQVFFFHFAARCCCAAANCSVFSRVTFNKPAVQQQSDAICARRKSRWANDISRLAASLRLHSSIKALKTKRYNEIIVAKKENNAGEGWSYTEEEFSSCWNSWKLL